MSTKKDTPEKWTRQTTLPMNGMLHCFIEGREREGDKIICRVDGYPDEAEAFEARVDLITSAPTLQSRIEELEAEIEEDKDRYLCLSNDRKRLKTEKREDDIAYEILKAVQAVGGQTIAKQMP